VAQVARHHRLAVVRLVGPRRSQVELQPSAGAHRKGDRRVNLGVRGLLYLLQPRLLKLESDQPPLLAVVSSTTIDVQHPSQPVMRAPIAGKMAANSGCGTYCHGNLRLIVIGGVFASPRSPDSDTTPSLMVINRLLAGDVGAGLAPAPPRAPARGAPTTKGNVLRHYSLHDH